MKVVLITTTTPASDNIRGTSALQYHLMIERDPSIEIIIYSYNFNELSEKKIHSVEKELKVTIKVLPKPNRFTWVLRLHLLVLRVFLKLPLLSYVKLSKSIIQEIKSLNPDGIWIYGEEISNVMMQFPEYKRVHLGPDSEALYYYRMLKQRFVLKDKPMFWRQAIMYPKYIELEKHYVEDKNATYYVVGEEDRNFIKNINPQCNVEFLIHPHYDLLNYNNENIKFKTPIRLLITGQYNLYMKQDVDQMIEQLIFTNHAILKRGYIVTFLGKGWENIARSLKEVGWNVEHIKFAPDYKVEICKHDIQIVPITIGTGTKGKVLDAMANGLLVIGSLCAMENISVKDKNSAVIYSDPADIVNILLEILADTSKYEDIAMRGRNCVLKAHNRADLSEILFNTLK